MLACLVLSGCLPADIEVTVEKTPDGSVPMEKGKDTAETEVAEADKASDKPDDGPADTTSDSDSDSDADDSTPSMAENKDGSPANESGGTDEETEPATEMTFDPDLLPDFGSAAAPAISVDNGSADLSPDQAGASTEATPTTAPEPPASENSGGTTQPMTPSDPEWAPNVTAKPAAALDAPFVALPPSLIRLVTRE